SQSQRERALGDLKRGRIQILVATDIASRGIDVEGITHVVNYDVPHTPEDYVHRIGRTGRVDAVGDAFTLMSPEEQKDITAIERFLGRTIPRVMLPDFDYKMRPKEPAGGGRTDHGRKGASGTPAHRGSRSSHRGGAPSPRGGAPSHRGGTPGHRGGAPSHREGGGHRTTGHGTASADSSSQQFGRRPKRVRGIDPRRGRL